MKRILLINLFVVGYSFSAPLSPQEQQYLDNSEESRKMAQGLIDGLRHMKNLEEAIDMAQGLVDALPQEKENCDNSLVVEADLQAPVKHFKSENFRDRKRASGLVVSGVKSLEKVEKAEKHLAAWGRLAARITAADRKKEKMRKWKEKSKRGKAVRRNWISLFSGVVAAHKKEGWDQARDRRDVLLEHANIERWVKDELVLPLIDSTPEAVQQEAKAEKNRKKKNAKKKRQKANEQFYEEDEPLKIAIIYINNEFNVLDTLMNRYTVDTSGSGIQLVSNECRLSLALSGSRKKVVVKEVMDAELGFSRSAIEQLFGDDRVSPTWARYASTQSLGWMLKKTLAKLDGEDMGDILDSLNAAAEVIG